MITHLQIFLEVFGSLRKFWKFLENVGNHLSGLRNISGSNPKKSSGSDQKSFSNSLIIHQVKTKKIITVKEVWIPGLN